MYRYAHSDSAGFIAHIAYIDGRWCLENGAGNKAHGQIISSYAHQLLIVVIFQLTDGKQVALALLPDSADADSLRRLRVWLRSHTAEITTTP